MASTNGVNAVKWGNDSFKVHEHVPMIECPRPRLCTEQQNGGKRKLGGQTKTQSVKITHLVDMAIKAMFDETFTQD